MTSVSNAPSHPSCYSDPNWESLSNVDILVQYRYSSCSKLTFSIFDNCVDQLGEINCVPLHQTACKNAISASSSIAAGEACCECGGGVAYSESPSLSPSEPPESSNALSIPIISGAAGGGLVIGILGTVFIMKKKRKRKKLKKKRRHHEGHEQHEGHTPNNQDVSKAWEVAASRVRKHNNRHRKPQEKPTISEFKKQKKNSKQESKHNEHRRKVENYRKQNDPRDRRETFVEDDYRRRGDVESQYATGSTVPGFHGGHGRFDEMMTNSIRNLFQNR